MLHCLLRKREVANSFSMRRRFATPSADLDALARSVLARCPSTLDMSAAYAAKRSCRKDISRSVCSNALMTRRNSSSLGTLAWNPWRMPSKAVDYRVPSS
jgi:hypothetical protein